MDDPTSSTQGAGTVPLSFRVDAAYGEWFELYRAGEMDQVDGFLAAQSEDVRPLLKERIREHLRLAGIVHDKDQVFAAGVLVDGDYELIRELGAGSSAVVWEARQLSLNRLVAIKFLQLSLALLSDRARDRFDREGRILAGVRHPGLVSVYASGLYGSIPYLVQELVEGSQTLSELLKLHAEELSANQAFGEQYDRKVAAWFLDVSLAMETVHDLEIFHRDVKPANILIGDDGRARLIDFGLGQMDDQVEISLLGELIGTPMYMSPEQFDGISNARTEMFALGTTLYEALTFQKPFFGDSVELVRQKVQAYDVPDPRSVRARIPEDLATIVMKMMEKNPAHRYDDMVAVSSDLNAFLAGEPISAVRPGRLKVGWRWLRRRPQLLVGVALGIFLAMATVGVVFIMSVQLKEENRLLDEELSQNTEEFANFAIQELLTKFEREPVFFDLDRSVPQGVPLFQLNAEGKALYELCGQGSNASLAMRARAYRRLIDAHLEYCLHEEAKRILDEAEVAGIAGAALGEFPVKYKALIELEQGEYHRAVEGLWEWQETYRQRANKLRGKYEDVSISSVESLQIQAELEDLEKRLAPVRTNLLIAALRGDLEQDLLRFRREIEDPEKYLNRRMETLGNYLPPSHPRVMKLGLAKGLLHSHLKEYEEAEKLFGDFYKQALGNERLMGANHPLTRDLQLEWAMSLSRMAYYEAAVLQVEDVLAWWSEISHGEPGTTPLNVLIPKWRLGWALLEQFYRMDVVSRSEEKAASGQRSLKLYSEVVAQMESTFGPENLNTLQAKTGYGLLLDGLGDHQGALDVAKETLAQKRKTSGKYNISTLISLRALYQAMNFEWLARKERGDTEGAAAIFDELVELYLSGVELQLIRVKNQHAQDQREGAAFQDLQDVEAGYCDFELATDFYNLGIFLSVNSEIQLSAPELARLRNLAGEMLMEQGNVRWQHDEVLSKSKEQVGAFLGKQDLSEEGQSLAAELQKASGGFGDL